jgi:hypothetical protein
MGIEANPMALCNSFTTFQNLLKKLLPRKPEGQAEMVWKVIPFILFPFIKIGNLSFRHLMRDKV